VSIDDELYGYLAGQFADADLLGQTDEQAAIDGVSVETKAAYQKVLGQGRAALASPSLKWQRIGDYANRVFKDEAEARTWLTRMMDLLEAALQKA
jgi:uncharacterized protein (DUF2384 family)